MNVLAFRLLFIMALPDTISRQKPFVVCLHVPVLSFLGREGGWAGVRGAAVAFLRRGRQSCYCSALAKNWAPGSGLYGSLAILPYLIPAGSWAASAALQLIISHLASPCVVLLLAAVEAVREEEADDTTLRQRGGLGRPPCAHNSGCFANCRRESRGSLTFSRTTVPPPKCGTLSVS